MSRRGRPVPLRSGHYQESWHWAHDPSLTTPTSPDLGTTSAGVPGSSCPPYSTVSSGRVGSPSQQGKGHVACGQRHMGTRQ